MFKSKSKDRRKEHRVAPRAFTWAFTTSRALQGSKFSRAGGLRRALKLRLLQNRKATATDVDVAQPVPLHHQGYAVRNDTTAGA